MKRATEDTLSLLAGAGMGMLAMYLLDPQSGARRRRQLAAVTREAVDVAGETIGPVVGSVAAGASRIGHSLAESVSEYGGHARESAGGFLSRAGESVSRGVSDFGTRASEGATSAWHGGKRMVGLEREESHFPVATTAAGGLGLLALGAGIAWLFDPDQGEARRHWLRDKSFSWLRDTGDLFRKTGKHIANYGQGTIAETRSKFRRRAEVPDEQLEARVRSQLGHVVQNLSDVTVIARTGYVTLIGTLPQGEIRSAESAARAVRGVTSVDCQLQPRSEPARSQPPSGAGSGI
jgi:hypothetical protein